MSTRRQDNLLYSAVTRGNANAVANVLRAGRVSKEQLNTSLQEAAYAGHGEIVALLYEYGADDIDGALRRSIRAGHYGVTRQLESYGARFNETLIDSVFSGNVVLVRHLLDKGVTQKDLDDALILAAGRNEIQVMRILLQSGAESLNEALKLAKAGNSTAVSLLIEYGADEYYGALEEAIKEYYSGKYGSYSEVIRTLRLATKL